MSNCSTCTKFQSWSDNGVEAEGGYCEDLRNASRNETEGFEYHQVEETDECLYHSEGSESVNIGAKVHHSMVR